MESAPNGRSRVNGLNAPNLLFAAVLLAPVMVATFIGPPDLFGYVVLVAISFVIGRIVRALLRGEIY